MDGYPLFGPVLGLFDRLGHAQSSDLRPMLGSAFRGRQDRVRVNVSSKHMKNVDTFTLWRSWRQARVALVVCVVVVGVSLSGCYWIKYTKLMRTHVELLLDMTDKMGSFLEDGRAITPRMMNEFLYPLERARDFARITERFHEGRTSLQEFERLLDVYADLLEETERLRILKGDLAGFRERAALVREWAGRVEAALAAEEA